MKHILAGVIALLVLCGCPDATDSKAPAIDVGPTATVGFSGTVSGAFAGEITGSGVVKFLPNLGVDKTGGYFLADGHGVRPLGVTFVLPPDTVPGRYELLSVGPLDQGSKPSVRVDRDTGKATVSSDRNTKGFLELKAFPAGRDQLAGAKVEGSYEFETENKAGEKITVKGSFSFSAP